MRNYQYTLARTVRKAREDTCLTQARLADSLGISLRTVINIENCRSNLKMEVLYPLIRILHIDPFDIFYPEKSVGQPSSVECLFRQISSCSEEEATLLYEICTAVLKVTRSTVGISLAK